MSDGAVPFEETSSVAVEYARALLALALADNQAKALDQELTDLTELIGRDAELAAFLETPVVSHAQKVDALLAAFTGRSSDLLVKFLCVLVRNGRGGLVRSVARSYRHVLNEHLSRREVIVTSAVALDVPSRARLEAILAERLNARPLMTMNVEPELIGGLQVRVGDELIDASVRSGLDELRRRLSTMSRPAGPYETAES